MIEKHFDVSFIAKLAMKEKQIQQSYRPVIAVHKWFARRPGTLFRGILLSEFSDGPLRRTFYQDQNLGGLTVADPFMGGGTPVLEANRVGCNVIGFDINPMAYWVVRQELADLDLVAYQRAADRLRESLSQQIGELYETTCTECGSPQAHVKYFIWVKVVACTTCGHQVELFPGYVLARDRRHPKNVLICGHCGALNEVQDAVRPGACKECSRELYEKGIASGGKRKCTACGSANHYPQPESGPPRHRMVAIEYHCPVCASTHVGRFFKKPDENDLAAYSRSEQLLGCSDRKFIPDDAIPAGDETNRLLRWGYRYYHEMFNARQLLGLELSCEQIAALGESPIRDALATNLSDLLRYQSMLTRYDTMALKSLDVFSIHGFPVGLIQCECNLLGITAGTRSNTGSGGWSNIITKYAKAKQFCHQPFEIVHENNKKRRVAMTGEYIGHQRHGEQGRQVSLRCSSSTEAHLPKNSVDAVLTDPPYFANVQYAELMDFCYVWLRKLVPKDTCGFQRKTTRNPQELTGNDTMGRDIVDFTAGLARAYTAMVEALKPGHPFVFTYHHNKPEGYAPIVVSLLDAGLTVSAALPCPAEMGASIHINGTGSSVVDTVFVCRTVGTVPKSLLASTPQELAVLVAEDVRCLGLASVRATPGDVKCIALGHMSRLAVWNLRTHWARNADYEDKLSTALEALRRFGSCEEISQFASTPRARATYQPLLISEAEDPRYVESDAVSF